MPSYQGLGSPGDAGKETAGINNRSARLESRPNTTTTTLSIPSLPSGEMLETRHKSGDRNGLGGGTQREGTRSCAEKFAALSHASTARP